MVRGTASTPPLRLAVASKEGTSAAGGGCDHRESSNQSDGLGGPAASMVAGHEGFAAARASAEEAGLLVRATGAALLQAARDEIRRYSESSSGWILMASCNNASE